MRTAKKRPYRMRARAASAEETRQRIVEATVRLHGTVGLAAATVTAIAEEAGVTRLTVYRHFPDVKALFTACSAHWRAQQVQPDAAAWEREADPVARLRVGLTDLYRFYRGGEGMLTNVAREWDVLPEDIRRSNQESEARWRDLLLEPFAVRGAAHRRLRSVLGHAVTFTTWKSLCVDQKLSNGEAVEAMIVLAVAAAADDSARR